MPDPAGTHNDGGMKFGSQVVGGYIAENISIDDDSNVIESKNENGVPNKQVFIDTVPTGSCTLQLEADSVLPEKYSELTLKDIEGTSVVFIIKKVGQAFQVDGETKVTVDLRKKLAT